MSYVSKINEPVEYVGRIRNVTSKIIDTDFGFKAMLKIESLHKDFGWLDASGNIVTFTLSLAETHHYFETIEAAHRATIRGMIEFGDESLIRDEDFL